MAQVKVSELDPVSSLAGGEEFLVSDAGLSKKASSLQIKGYVLGSLNITFTGPTEPRTYTLPDADATLLTTTSVVDVPQGGTGLSSYAVGDLIYADAVDSLTALADVATGNALLSGGVGVAPAWGKIGLTTHVDGILPAANGGTGLAFVAFSGPASTVKTFTLPNSNESLAILGAQTFTGNQTLADNQLIRPIIKDGAVAYFNSGTTNALDYTNGSHQRWAPNTGSQTLSITNWPPTGNLGELLIEGVNLGAATITWPTINWIKSDGTTTTTFSSNGVTLQASGTDWVFLWTRDAGTTIYGKIVR